MLYVDKEWENEKRLEYTSLEAKQKQEAVTTNKWGEKEVRGDWDERGSDRQVKQNSDNKDMLETKRGARGKHRKTERGRERKAVLTIGASGADVSISFGLHYSSILKTEPLKPLHQLWLHYYYASA